MSTPTWGIPATCSGEGVGQWGAGCCGVGPALGSGAGLAGWRRVTAESAPPPSTRRHSGTTTRYHPGATVAPLRLRLHHLDAGPRVFRLDQLIHPLRATRMQPKHRPIRNMCRAHRLLLIQP